MEYLIEYNNFKQKTILYIHGLDAQKHNKNQIKKQYKKIVNDLGFDYVSIFVDYRKDDVWDIISKINIDGVIGHSVGGYMANELSNFKQIPALLLMPSFDKKDIKLQKIPNDVKDKSTYKKKLVLIGEKDKSVDNNLIKKTLKGIDILSEDIDHDVDNKIFKKYCKLFVDKFY